MCKSEKNRKNETNTFPVWLIVGIVGVLILLAYVVHRLSPQIASLITADGMLSYIGSGISSVATIVLAIVAYRQTERANSMADKLTQQSNSFAEQANELAQQSNKVAKRANELTEKANGISERVTNLEEERFKMEIRPFVLVTDWSVYRAVRKLRTELTEEHLWEVVLLYSGVRFKTYSGLPFTYEIRKGRNGQYTKELWIDRRENSKSLAWSSVLLALNNMKEVGAVVDRPKALGDIRGVTYIYGMFYRFGLIEMPDKVNGKMKRAGRQM